MNIVALFILKDHQHIIQSCFAVEHCGISCKYHWKDSFSKQYYTYTVHIHSTSLDHILSGKIGSFWSTITLRPRTRMPRDIDTWQSMIPSQLGQWQWYHWHANVNLCHKEGLVQRANSSRDKLSQLPLLYYRHWAEVHKRKVGEGGTRALWVCVICFSTPRAHLIISICYN
jgi:hypothetical protein